MIYGNNGKDGQYCTCCTWSTCPEPIYFQNKLKTKSRHGRSTWEAWLALACYLGTYHDVTITIEQQDYYTIANVFIA